MKLLLVIYSGADPQLVPTLFDRHHAGGYTELDHAHGRGASGPLAGTRAWPGDASLYFSIVARERVDEMTEAFRAAAAVLEPGERLHVAVMPTDTFF